MLQLLYMKLFQKGGFTLVELIVVLVILSLLSTIGFVTYSQYLGLVRDTNRVSNMAALSDGMEMYSAENSLPLPENKVEIRSNGEVIARQGDAGPTVLEAIDFVRGGKEPQNGEYMSYYLTKDKRYFQLMTFLEGSIDDLGLHMFDQTHAAVVQSDRSPIVTGKKLGILTDENNVPIHKVAEVQLAGHLDISTSTGTYISHFNDRGSLRGNTEDLDLLVDLSKNGGKPNNCLTWVLMNPDLEGKQWNYQITDIKKNQYFGYCDWTWALPIPEDGGDEYELISSWAITNGNFANGTDIPTESGSVDSNVIIELPIDEIPEEIVEEGSSTGYVIEQEGDESDYKVEIEDTDTDGDGKTEKEEFEELGVGDVVKMCGWVKNLDNNGYIFNNIVEYIDGKKSYNGKLIKMFEKEKKWEKWEYQCVEHTIIGTPVDFLWRIGYRAESINKKFYMWGLEIKLYKKK